MAAQTKSIKVDCVVHQKIEAEKREFDEPPNMVLRRLLDIGDLERETSPGSGNADTSLGESWVEQGVSLPEGTELEVDYSGTQAYGRVCGGKLKFGASLYSSLSRAVSGIIAEKSGTRVQANGWKHIYVKRPGDEDWILADELRAKQRISN